MPRLLTLCSATLLACAGHAAERETFAADTAMGSYEVQGPVSRDTAQSASADGSGSLRVAAGGKVIIPLREGDGSGRISFKVYEDEAKPADPKKRASGALWGVQQSDGHMLTIGALYAPYLGGDSSYALTNLKQGDSPFGFVRHLGIKRSKGWHEWVFDFHPKRGLTITCDGNAITEKRFDWNESKQHGFNALVFIGDQTDGNGGLWIDDIEVTLGGPMEVGPKPEPVVAMVPDQDPTVAGDIVGLLPAIKDVHPRLLFGPDDIPRLREFYHSEAAADFRKELEDYLPTCVAPKEPAFLKDATDGQRQGYWRMPTCALHYVLTGDKASLQKSIGYIKMLLALPNWETGGELDSGMSAANIMIGAGLTLDWLWHDLDPDLREQFRKKCLYHARAMYHGGHLKKSPNKVHYWQADPGNNHRWHRNAGLASCLFAAATGAAEEAWIMTEFKKELDFIVKWLPEDGTTHESPGYMTFGLSHLIIGTRTADRCLGTDYLQQPFFAHVAKFKTQAVTPGYQHQWNYGDQGGIGNGKLNYDLALYLCTGIHGQKAEQAALDKMRRQEGAGWGWMGIVYYNPEVAGGDPDSLATSVFLPDIGVLWSRSSWAADGRGVQFKCGPFGGYKLNRFRNSTNFGYINVAHDDPDANSFLLYADGKYLAETDRYSENKKSSHFNTILINGTGQMASGRGEGGVWSQPATGDVDMTTMAVVTAAKITDAIDVVEGEAAGSYLASTNAKYGPSRPALDRYRRALAHVKGDYVLVLDDIRAPEAVTITWMVQAPQLTAGTDKGWWTLANEGTTCPFQLATNRDDVLDTKIVPSPADSKKGKLMGWQQLRAETSTDHLITASAYALYGKTVSVALDTSDPARIVATVTGEGLDDRWEWAPTTEATATYTLTATRAGKILVQTGPDDRPETE